MTAPPEIAGLTHAALEQLVLKLLSESAEQQRMIAELREEIARLKGLKGRLPIKPSGMEAGTSYSRRRGQWAADHAGSVICTRPCRTYGPPD